MNIIIKTGAFAVLVSLAACGSAGTEQENRSAAKSVETEVQTHSTIGTVEKVSADQVTIAHGPVETLRWPAMTMAFSAQDAALLEGIGVGDRVTFSFTPSGGAYALTAISKK